MRVDVATRHEAVQDVIEDLRAVDHLPPKQRRIKTHIADLADVLLLELPDSRQLTEALKHLRYASDFAVRASLKARPPVRSVDPLPRD